MIFALSAEAKAQAPRALAGTNAFKARVVIVEQPDAMWDLRPVPERVQAMVDQGVTKLTRESNLRAAWRSIVSPKEIVGIKVFTEPGPVSGTRRAVVAAVVQDLLDAGLPATNIIVWDRRLSDLLAADYSELTNRFGIRLAGAIESGYDLKVFYESPLLGALAADDVEFNKTGAGVGRKSYVSKLITKQVTKIINITPLLHHNLIGASGNLYSLALGSVDNFGRFENKAEDLSRAVPEICALPITRDEDRLGDRIVLNIVDALICQYEGQEHGLLHYSTTLDQLRFSKDPVALDTLSYQEINLQRERAGSETTNTNIELYANASLLEIGVSDTNKIQVETIR